MTNERLAALIARQFTGELLPEEARELRNWAQEDEHNRAFLERLSGQGVLEKELGILNRLDPAFGYERWTQRFQPKRPSSILRIGLWSAAAGLLIAVALFDLIHSSRPAAPAIATVAPATVLPGRSTAILTLANGQQMLLDSMGKGQLSVQGDSRVIKEDSSSLSYLAAASAVPGYGTGKVGYNVLTTPRSGQYRLVLPDGSRVWLNNVSSVRYPTSFEGPDRTVEVSGEAYFEIAPNPGKPFFVKVGNETIQVLGTSFNVSAYPDEAGIQTTLLTGALRVRTPTAEVKLRPGEQAQTTAGDRLTVVKDAEAADVASWKDGFFYFGRASFAAMMRQLARWYDVEVVYQGKVPEMEFGGKIDRSLPLSDLLKFLDKNQIHFRLEGRKLVVLPN